MKVQDLMTREPACATPEMGLSQIAKMMAEFSVGAIPVVENQENHKLVGMITDRDIATRAVAQGKNPLTMKAKEVMTSPVVAVRPDDDVQDTARTMEQNMIRRVPVVESNGEVTGMVAQADIALKASKETTAEVVQAVSKPTQASGGMAL